MGTYGDTGDYPDTGALAGTETVLVDDGVATQSTTVQDIADLATNASNLTSGTVADARIASTIARDTEVTAAIAALSSVYQPLDSDLTAIAALTTTTFGRSLLEAANASALRTLAGLVIGTDVQAYDAELAALASTTSAADALPYFTGSGTATTTTITSAARTVLDDTTVGAMLTTLGAVDKANGGKETINTQSTATGATTLDLANGNIFDITMTGNVTLTFSGSTSSVACSFTLIARQDGTGSRTITWPASVDWAGGTAPTISTAASRVDTFVFTTVDNGTTWLGYASGIGVR